MLDQLYRKKNGKYIKHNDPIALEGLTQGAWLVVVNKNCTSIRSAIDPKFIELDASLYYLREGLCKAMAKKSALHPTNTQMSKKELKAWEAYRKVMGNNIPTYFEYASFDSIAQEGCDYVKKAMLENDLDVAKIKKKYHKQLKKLNDAISSLEI